MLASIRSRQLTILGTLVLNLGSLLSMSSGQQNQPPKAEIDIHVGETQALETAHTEILADKAILLDVREADERTVQSFQKSKHIATSVLQDEASRRSSLQTLSKDKPVYCHCKGGGRAQRVAALLRELGYDARAIAMPFEDIKKAGFATE